MPGMFLESVYNQNRLNSNRFFLFEFLKNRKNCIFPKIKSKHTMGLLKEFKEFSVKGNALDLAVGVIIGAAFGKIVSSIVNDIIMPPIGMLVGGVDFKGLKFVLKNPVTDAAGKVISEGVTLNYGNFLQTTFDFLIIAFCVFMLVKLLNSFKKKEEAKPPEIKEEVVILKEIRDALTKK